MTTNDKAGRLERLWAGDFGDSYTDRNIASGDGRRSFWSEMLRQFPVASALEVGCNVGANLRWLTSLERVVGVDVNHHALVELRERLPSVRSARAMARSLPFADGAFDLVFTMGVLIHQPPEALPDVMAEIVRCSGRYVICGEYFATEPTEISYRGETGALFKRDFGGLYQQLFSSLAPRATGFLPRDTGWDDVTYWVFEKVG